jgi:hypothetical protein
MFTAKHFLPVHASGLLNSYAVSLFSSGKDAGTLSAEIEYGSRPQSGGVPNHAGSLAITSARDVLKSAQGLGQHSDVIVLTSRAYVRYRWVGRLRPNGVLDGYSFQCEECDRLDCITPHPSAKKGTLPSAHTYLTRKCKCGDVKAIDAKPPTTDLSASWQVAAWERLTTAPEWMVETSVRSA